MEGANNKNVPEPNNNSVQNRNDSPKYYLIWVDEKVNNEENKSYKLEIQEKIKKYNIISFQDVESSIEKILELFFEETFVILNREFYKDFIKSFMNKLPDINVIPKIIIFTGNKKRFLDTYKDSEIKEVLSNKYYTLGGIQTSFESIKNFLSKDSWRDRPNIEDIKFDGEESKELTFEYVDSTEKLALPTFFKSLIKIDENDNFEKLNQYLYSKYSCNNDVKNLLSQIEGIPSIPLEILCKYYARLYTIESNFYKDINKFLRRKPIKKEEEKTKSMKFFLPYVKLLYEGLKLSCFSYNFKDKLYRFSRITPSEKTLIDEYLSKKKEGLPGAICFSRSFLSFSKERKVAEDFLIDNNTPEKKNDELLNIIFILQKKENNDEKNNEKNENENGKNENNTCQESLFTFIDLSVISKIDKEKEVLFLPFSAFEIKDTIKKFEDKKNNITGYEIELDYLDKYADKIKSIKNNNEIISNTPYKEELYSSGIIDISESKNKTYQNVIEGFKNYEKTYTEIKTGIKNKKYNEIVLKDMKEAEKKKSSNISIKNPNNDVSNNNNNTISQMIKVKRTCLKNLGDTSYLNSVLLCLSNIEELKKYFTDKRNINFIKTNAKKLALSFFFEELFKNFYLEKEKKDLYTPEHILKILGFYNENFFKDTEINNPNKCLIYVLKILHYELNRLKNNKENNEYDKKDRNMVINYGIKNFFNTNDSVISDNFNWLEIKQYECSECAETIYDMKTFNYFNLELLELYSINKKELKIEECINFKSQEKKESQDCLTCNKKCPMKSISAIYRSPKIFVFLLDRGNANGEQLEVPFYLEEEINLESCIEDKKAPKKYKLIGLVSINKDKKYIAFYNTFKEGFWYFYNDEECYKIQQKELIDNHNNNTFIPCILFYKSN